MADINKLITMVEKGSISGPYYDIYYSLNCVDYTLAVDGNDVYLPLVGSTAVVTIPEESVCIKLVSTGPECTNDVIKVFGTTTTSTTSTTTSTTTIPPCEIKAYTAQQGTVTYIDPYDVERTITHSSTSRIFLAKQIVTSSYTPVPLTRTPVSIPFDYCTDINLDYCSGSIYSAVPNQDVAYHYAYYIDGTTLLPVETPVWQLFGGGNSINSVCMVSGSLMIPNTTTVNRITITYEGTCETNCSTTTTTTSTTSPTSTTTSTTTAVCVCNEWLIENYSQVPGDTLYVNYVDCNTQQTLQVLIPYDSSGTVCSCSEPVRVAGPTSIGIFNQGACSTTTSTSTSTTTSTTAPTTSTTTTTTGVCVDYTCGDGYIYHTTDSTSYGIYPVTDICEYSSTCFSIGYDAVDRPNRFNVYDSTGLIWTSGWVGYATWSGPWGASLNVTPSGNSTIQQFNSTTGRYVQVEYGPADPLNPTGDSANWIMSCQTCPIV